jgi:hypothetical protein
LPLLAVAVLVIIILCLVRAANRRHQHRAYRAIIEVRERAEADRVAEQIDAMYRRAVEAVRRL